MILSFFIKKTRKKVYKEDQDPSRLTFVVAGGGFTGVEMLGELIESLPKLSKQYNVPFEKVKIEAAVHLLPFFGQESIQYTTDFLEKHQVKIMTKTKLLECTPDKIILENNAEIPTKTLIWSCGVKANSILQNSSLQLVRGKVPVDANLMAKGMNHIFCVGECSLFMKNEQSALPSTAQVAIQQAAVCAENIAATIRGEKLIPFEYQHKVRLRQLKLGSSW